MQTYTTGKLVGSGSFHCENCEYSVTLEGPGELPECCNCGGTVFYRASIFVDPATQPIAAPEIEVRPSAEREQLSNLGPGQYLAYEYDDRFYVVPLKRECTRIGRSVSADIRLDDPTVSRRHAIIQRHGGWVSILDDRSLNGVFVDDEKVERSRLSDGDEIVIGRFKLIFVDTTRGKRFVHGEHAEKAGSHRLAASR